VPVPGDTPEAADAHTLSLGWVRLVIPLVVRDNTVGLWLFGRRDPDDYYPRQDIDLLDSLGAQVAVTLENIRLYEQAQREIRERTQAERRLQASLEEKVVLLQEVHHRVKNNLQIISSLLSLQSQQIEDAQAWEALEASRSRMRVMSLVHETLYTLPDLAQIDMASYVRTQVMHLWASYSQRSRDVDLQVDVDDVLLGIDAGVPCGMLVNELVSNALKHAFPVDMPDTRQPPPRILVRLQRQDDGRLILEVADNGIGLPRDIDMDDPQSLGLQLIQISAQQLNGEIALDRRAGTRFTVTFSPR